MSDWISFLSSGIPGGIFLLLFVLFILNLTLHFLKNSELMSRQTWKKNLITFNLAVFLLYIAFWFITQPPRPQERIIALPSVQNNVFKLEANAFLLPEALERAARNNTADQFLVHRWEWLYETIRPELRKSYEIWLRTAKALKPRYLIQSKITNQQMICEIFDLKKKTTQQISGSLNNGIAWFIRQINDRLEIFKETPVPPAIDATILTARLALFNKDYEQVLQLLKNRTDVPAKTLIAAVYIEKGLAMRVDQERAKYVSIQNPDFDKAKSILIPIVKNRQDTPEIDLLMGRMLIREKEYTSAEMFLKKAYVEDPENCRIHFALGFLLPERLQDIGYQNRIEILKRAIELDPGFREAVFQLANEIYLSGRGTLGSIQEAIKIINQFLKIHPGDPEMLSLLGSLYIKTKHAEKALPIFQKLFKQFPNDSDSYYNLGVCYYMLKQDSTALKYFMKAIQMDQNLDSYLYVGQIYRKMGKLDSALKYFRERVARKTGDDDKYAIEAMQGIQQVLIKMEELKSAAQSDSTNKP